MKVINESVFESAEGYHTARIPGIVLSADGTLTAYCELRRSGSDWAVIDIGVKRSLDGGRHWSEREILVSGGKNDTVNNPLMIADGNTLHFFRCLNYSRVFYMKSTDGGRSWGEERELTERIRECTGDFFWSCIATGPTHGLCLSTGRLLVPLWLAFNREDPKSHHPSVVSFLYSDDSGESFSTGEIFCGLNDPSEFCIAELGGKTLINIRHENEEKCRAVGEITPDGRFSDIRFLKALPDPVCCAGMCSTGDEILFSNCEDEKERIKLTLKRLDGRFNITERLLLSEKGGYSDIAVNPETREAVVLFERDNKIFCNTVLL